MTRKQKYPAPPIEQVSPPERAAQINEIVYRSISTFSGVADDLEKAIGMLMVGDYYGWKVLVVIHNKRTIRKYEEILGISIREFFPEEGPIAKRSLGYELAQKLGNFWKVVSGDISVENRREISNQ